MSITPESRWKSLKQLIESNSVSTEYILANINLIDKDTPWSDSEPSWWLEMINTRRDIYNQVHTASNLA